MDAVRDAVVDAFARALPIAAREAPVEAAAG